MKNIVLFNKLSLTKLVSGSNTAMEKSRSKYSRNSLTNPVTSRPDEQKKKQQKMFWAFDSQSTVFRR